MARDPDAWFRQPVLWLGAVILAASLFACVVTIVLAMRHADSPIETAGGSVIKIPSGPRADSRPAEREAR